MAKTPSKTETAAPARQTVLRITAKRDGFRRCGVAHPGTATDHPIDRFTPDQVEALKAEPMLVVHEVETDTPAERGAPGSQPGAGSGEGSDPGPAGGPPSGS